MSEDLDGFLASVTGVIHIGANTGQERELYSKHQLNVAWVEALPKALDELKNNIVNYPEQIACWALVLDQDDELKEFFIANNFGASSSILALKECYKIWPEIFFNGSIKIKSCTLPTLIAREGLKLDNYQALVLDTQGSELLVLKGAESILNHFDFIKTEVSDFEAYEGCVMIGELTDYLEGRGFVKIGQTMFACNKEASCHYYDVLFARKKSQLLIGNLRDLNS